MKYHHIYLKKKKTSDSSDNHDKRTRHAALWYPCVIQK